MVAAEFRISEQSIPILEQFVALPRRDPIRISLFAFLAEAASDPNGVAFEQDDDGLRFTWLTGLTIAWRVDLVRSEIDVLDVWTSPFRLD